uniref:Tc1-like transposase DDE domain-containing protein n=1 Tax=Sander lucioperca TaxID=283035 RepID=A0A8D0AUU4_SANLU
MGKKGDLSNSERGMVVGARRAGLSIFHSAQLLGFSCPTISKVYKEWSEKGKTSSMRGQRRMGRLIPADRRSTLTQITTRYNRGMQPSICEATTRTTLRWMGYTNWKNVAWSDESRFLLRYSEGRVRIWRKQNENMEPSCLVTTGQAGGGVVMVWGMFFFRPLSTNWASFRCQSLPEHYINPIEHLWDVVERELRALDVHPTSLHQLQDAILSIWANISRECFQHLVESMPRRIEAVLKAKGGQTRKEERGKEPSHAGDTDDNGTVVVRKRITRKGTATRGTQSLVSGVKVLCCLPHPPPRPTSLRGFSPYQYYSLP